MREISLTNSDKVVLVDDEDYERISSVTWALTPQGYPRRNANSRIENGKRKQDKIYLHRFLMNTPKGLRCDHINHNILDCRRSNLRNVTCSLNNLNRAVAKDHPTGVNGVLPTDSGKFSVSMSIGNKGKQFGTFDTLEEAIKVRQNLNEKRYAGSLV